VSTIATPETSEPPTNFARRLFRVFARLTRRKKPPRRRFIPNHIGVEGFFHELDSRRIRYAVLRWFDRLPDLDPDEDIDLLVHDEDFSAIADLFDSSDGVPCDVYSVSGKPGGSSHGVPYLPPTAAAKLLERAEKRSGLFRVPCREDYFLSLAYHAVYHKGLRSGLPTTLPGLVPESHPEHDYARVLGELALELGIDVSVNLDSLDSFLVEQGWQPSPAMTASLKRRNRWLLARAERVTRGMEGAPA
jgi:hypothetical protein